MNRLLRAANSTVVTHPGIFRFDMSIIQRLIGHGRALLRYHFEGICNKNQILGKLDPISLNVGKNPSAGINQQIIRSQSPGTFEWIGKGIQAHVRRIFVTNVIRRVSSSLSPGLQNRASQQLLNANNSRPFFALVGVSLASGAGVLTKPNEFEGICWEIRESFEKKQRQLEEGRTVPSASASAVVSSEEREETPKVLSVDNFEFGRMIAQGAQGAIYSARWKSMERTNSDEEFPLGIKMLFNFYCESNSALIMRTMAKEIVPARHIDIDVSDLDKLTGCPPHPNIIEISHVFTDQVPMLPQSLEKYPDALPRRLYQSGLGRNMSLFLVMKRYDTNLQKYLQSHENLKLKNRVLILTQLLEGVAHLTGNEIAHRDLKSDNILLETSIDQNYPHLVITDFGCCLADKSIGLNLPFPSVETDRGGNAALMAPEVAGATPGILRKISFEKSDVWSCGAIAYEIFGHKNPFVYYEGNNTPLDSRTYKDSELPIIDSIPSILNSLVHSLLKRKPKERLSGEVAATICHIYLWGPTRWLFYDTQKITDSEIMQWLLTLTTKLLCQSSTDSEKVEFTIIRTFLTRLRFSIVKVALDWIHGNTVEIEVVGNRN